MKALRLTIAMTFIMISAYCFFNFGLKGKPNDQEIVKLDTGWTVLYKGDLLTDVDLDDYKAYNALKGDTMILTNVLPECGIQNASIMLSNYLAEMDIYVDDELIYVTGIEEYREGKLIGYGKHVVDLPLGYEGKKIKVVFRSGENNGIGSLPVPLLMGANEVDMYLLKESFLPSAIAVTDIVIGISMIGIGLVYVIDNHGMRQMLYIGLFSFFIGLWSFCEHDVILLINPDYQLKTISEYLALYLAPIFVFAYFWIKVKDKTSRIKRNVYRLLFIGDIALTSVTILLQLFNLVHLTQMLKLQHTFILIMISYMMFNFVQSILEKDKQEVAFYIGIVALSLCGVTDIIIFNLLAYSSKLSGNFDGISYMGSGILVISMVMDFSDEMSRRVRQASEMEVYEQMANSDYLTGLANRRQCELVFDDIDQNDSDYAVIAFDLNNLKEVNDKHGHAAGDKLLKDFANILKGVFESVGTVGRTGGDEFLVIIRHAEVLNINRLLEGMDNRIEEINKKRRDYKISVARGTCTKLENKKNVRSAYRTADQRMYENKMLMKAEAKGKME